MWKWLDARTVPRWHYGLLAISFVCMVCAFWLSSYAFWKLQAAFDDWPRTRQMAEHPELYRGLLAGRGTREDPLTMDDLAPVLKAIRQREDARSPEL